MRFRGSLETRLIVDYGLDVDISFLILADLNLFLNQTGTYLIGSRAIHQMCLPSKGTSARRVQRCLA